MKQPHRLGLFACAAFALAPLSSHAAELLQNGAFDNVLAHWTEPPATGGGAYIHEGPGGHVTIHPPVHGYNGTVLRQNLNVPGLANQIVSLSVDARMPWENGERTLAVYLEFSRTDGSTTRAKILNPENSIIVGEAFTTLNENFTFPADADRLLNLTIDKEDFGEVRADNVSLTSATLTPGPLPKIGTVAPNRLAYGETVQIDGANFGPTEGLVRLDGSDDGITINSWSDSAIQVTVGDPASSGHLSIVRDDQVPTTDSRHLAITSPYFSATRFRPPDSFGGGEPDNPIAIPGQIVYTHVDIDCFNGCNPPGGISFSVLEDSSARINPLNVAGDGGTRIGIDTTGLTPGLHSYTIQASATGFPPRSFPLTIDLREPGTLEIATWDPIGMTAVPVPNPWNLASRENVDLTITLKDSGGADLTPHVPLGLRTSDPSVAEVFLPDTPWEVPKILPQDDGNCTISVNGPGGLQRDFPVTVTVPADPAILAFSLDPAVIDNSGTSTTTSVADTSRAMIRHDARLGSHELTTLSQDFSNGNQTHTMEIQADQGMAPGSYLFRRTATFSDGTTTERSRLITVVNDPNTGTILGHLALMRDPFFSDGANGTVEFYNATTGVKEFERLVFEFSWRYTIGSIPPGSYKIRWTTGTTPGHPVPQWYGNAYDIGDAATVTVDPGSVTPGINFFLDLHPDTITPLPAIQQPQFDPLAGEFQLVFPTEEGYEYILLKSLTGEDGTWYNVTTVSGDSSSAILKDSDASEDAALYRVSRR